MNFWGRDEVQVCCEVSRCIGRKKEGKRVTSHGKIGWVEQKSTYSKVINNQELNLKGGIKSITD